MKRNRREKPPRQAQVGSLSRAAGQTLKSYSLGALPIVNQIIARARIGEFLGEYLREDERCTIAPSVGILVLLKNFLTSRQPIYGVSEWACRHSPRELELTEAEAQCLNDDRVGRCLDRLFEADRGSLVLATVAHVVKAFQVSLDELHNDSTTLTFSGEYDQAAERLQVFGKATRIITWGYNKDHRPDLKQLLYTLTVTRDGAVPVNFDVGDGNLTDDQTHRDTWDLARKITGTADFLYVADSKLATEDNMAHIHKHGGRFVTVLPRTRGEDKAFRARLAEGQIAWAAVCTRLSSDGQHEDEVSIAAGEEITKDGYRLLWFKSTRKAELDATSRARKIYRAGQALNELRTRMKSPRTRFTEESKVRAAVEKCLADSDVSAWLVVQIQQQDEEHFKQLKPGRPSKETEYRREVKTRFDLIVEVNHAAVTSSAIDDGVFPLVSNDTKLTPKEILEAYKRQASIEKRFSQLKTDYQLAPVFLKAPHRIEAMLCVYFFALMVQALLERELRKAMQNEGVESLDLYPEERECRAPTAAKIIELFEHVQRHELQSAGEEIATCFVTELTRVQKQALRLLKVQASEYKA